MNKPILNAAYNKNNSINYFLFFVLVATGIASFGNFDLMGFNLAGWIWLGLLTLSFYLAVVKPRYSKFPLLEWVPFFIFVLLRTDFENRADLQRVGILLTPVLVGYVGSIYVNQILGFRILNASMRYLTIAIVLIYFIAVYEVGSFVPRENWFALAGFCMTLTLAAIIFMYGWIAHKDRSSLVFFLFAYFVIFISESRNPTIVVPLLFMAATWKSSNKWKTVIYIISVIFLAIFAFNSDPVQQNLFRSGSGTFEDLYSLQPDQLKSGGRLTIWPVYLDNIPDWWIGGGGTASVDFGNSLNWASHPHNEYIRVIFDYGLLGLFLLLWPLALLYFRLTKYYRNSKNEDVKALLFVSRYGLLGMALLAITGNVLLYVAWYGNLLFVICGIALRQASLELRSRHPGFT